MKQAPVLRAGIVLRLNEIRLEATGLNPQAATGEPNRSCADAPEPFQLFGLTQFLEPRPQATFLLAACSRSS